MTAKEVGRRLGLETREIEQRRAEIEQANQQAFTRLVREFVAKAGQRRPRGRPRGRDPLPKATYARLWRTYRLGRPKYARVQACAAELVVLLALPAQVEPVIARGLRDEVVGTRQRELVELTRAFSGCMPCEQQT